MLLAHALLPGMLERGARAPGLRRLARRQGAEPRAPRLQRDQVRPARLLPRASHRSSRQRRRRLDRRPRLHPRRRHVRRLRSDGATRAGHLDPGRVADGVVRAIERDSSRSRRAPAQQRALAHFAAAAPELSRLGRPRQQVAAELVSGPPTSARPGAQTDKTWRVDEQRLLRIPGHPRGGRAQLRDPPTRRTPTALRRRPPAVLDQGAAGERAAPRGRRLRDRRRRRGDRPWEAGAEPSAEIPYQPARVLMQDFTGVPAVVDLAAMRDAMEEIGGDPAAINPLVDVDLVIDHSVQVDAFGNAARLRDQRRARVRAQPRALLVPELGPARLRQLPRRPAGDRDLPPGQPRVHLPGRLQPRERRRPARPIPTRWSAPTRTRRWSTASGCWAGESAGSRPRRRCSASRSRCCCRRCVGFRLDGELPEGATATDLVLTVTEMLRERGVVSKFVEFFGPGLPTLGLADRATIGNMSPEFGSTCAIFPVDAETLRYLEFTGRPTETIELVDAYAREQGMFHDAGSEDPTFSDLLELDLGDVEPSIAGPKRPQDRVPLARRQAGVPRGDGGVRPGGCRADGERPRRGDRGVIPSLRPAGRGPMTTSGASRASRSAAPRRPPPPSSAVATASRFSSRTAPASSSTTAAS